MIGVRWQDQVNIVIEAGLSTTGNAQWDKARFDANRWSAQENWTAIPCDEVVSLSIQPNRSDELSSTGAASCSIEVANLYGVWTTAPPRGLRPGVVVRVRMVPKVVGITARTLFYGWLEGITESLSYEFPVATIELLDAWARVATWNEPPGGPAVGPELSGAMFNHVLDRVSWPAAARVVGVGVETVQVLGGGDTGGLNGTAAKLLDDLAWLEQGVIWSDEQGRIVFSPKRPGPPASTYTVGVGPGAICAATFTVQRSAVDVVNDQIVQGTNTEPQRASDLASVTRYGWRTGPPRTGLPLIDDAHAARIAHKTLRPSAVLHVTAIELDPEADPAAWQVIANTRPGHVLTAQFPDGTRLPVLVLGVTTDADPSSWVSTVHCLRYPSIVRWDSARFDSSQWAA